MPRCQSPHPEFAKYPAATGYRTDGTDQCWVTEVGNFGSAAQPEYYCVFHAPPDTCPVDRDDWPKEAQGKVQVETLVRLLDAWRQAVAAAPEGEAPPAFVLPEMRCGTVDFKRAAFPADLVLPGAHFTGPVSLHSAVFDGRVNLSWVVFREGLDLHSATFAGPVRFISAEFRGAAGFESVRFGTVVDFASARFAAAADFESAEFKGDADFEGTEFSDRADFRGARFMELTAFDAADFAGTADFRGARFTKDASFHGVRFGGHAVFRG